MKFCAVGDVIIGRRIQDDFAGYNELAPIINKADAKFFNLETTLNMDGKKSDIGLPRLCTDPELLSDFIARCEKFGTKLIRNDDGSYDCQWTM